MQLVFEPKPDVGEVFEAYASECLDCARTDFGYELELSSEGVKVIEAFATVMNGTMPPGVEIEVGIERFSRLFGSYIAQVLIVEHGWLPGVAKLDDVETYGVQLDGHVSCWPWLKARSRFVNGGADNLWHYFQYATEQGSAQARKEPPKSDRPQVGFRLR